MTVLLSAGGGVADWSTGIVARGKVASPSQSCVNGGTFTDQ